MLDAAEAKARVGKVHADDDEAVAVEDGARRLDELPLAAWLVRKLRASSRSGAWARRAAMLMRTKGDAVCGKDGWV